MENTRNIARTSAPGGNKGDTTHARNFAILEGKHSYGIAFLFPTRPQSFEKLLRGAAHAMYVSCPSCDMPLSLFPPRQAEAHVNECLDAQAAPAAGFDAQGVAQCGICSRDLSALTHAAREAHANRCADETLPPGAHEQRPARRPRAPRAPRGQSMNTAAPAEPAGPPLCARVARLLDVVGLTRYASRFAQNEIDIATLSALTDDEWVHLKIPHSAKRRISDALLGAPLLEPAVVTDVLPATGGSADNSHVPSPMTQQFAVSNLGQAMRRRHNLLIRDDDDDDDGEDRVGDDCEAGDDGDAKDELPSSQRFDLRTMSKPESTGPRASRGFTQLERLLEEECNDNDDDDCNTNEESAGDCVDVAGTSFREESPAASVSLPRSASVARSVEKIPACVCEPAIHVIDGDTPQVGFLAGGRTTNGESPIVIQSSPENERPRDEDKAREENTFSRYLPPARLIYSPSYRDPSLSPSRSPSPVVDYEAAHRAHSPSPAHLSADRDLPPLECPGPPPCAPLAVSFAQEDFYRQCPSAGLGQMQEWFKEMQQEERKRHALRMKAIRSEFLRAAQCVNEVENGTLAGKNIPNGTVLGKRGSDEEGENVARARKRPSSGSWRAESFTCGILERIDGRHEDEREEVFDLLHISVCEKDNADSVIDEGDGDEDDDLLDLTQHSGGDERNENGSTDPCDADPYDGKVEPGTKAKPRKLSKLKRSPVAQDADVLRAIRDCTAVYDKVLALEPVELNAVMAEVKRAGFRIGIAKLGDLLDRQGVSYKSSLKETTAEQRAYLKTLNSQH
jgi:SAM domain (Sterile alpha motif)